MSAVLPVEDRLEILDLYARQSHHIDSGQADEWAATFAPDGVFESPTYDLVARGAAELAAFARESNAASAARGELFRHRVSDVVLTLRSDGGLDALGYLTILAVSRDGTRIDRTSRIHDRLVRVDGRWRFASRWVQRDVDELGSR